MKLSTLDAMNDEDRARALSSLVGKATAPRNGQARMLDGKIHAFEVRYAMTSEEMRSRFSRNEMQDTPDVAEWLLLLSARGTSQR